MQLDLNCDLGESFGVYTVGCDEVIIPLITSANIACGFHAGDADVMAKTVALCKKNGVQVGCHPGYKDLEGFGRRAMTMTPSAVKNSIKYQLGALMAFARSENVKVGHLKPHGALYNLAAKDFEIACAIAEGIYEVDPNVRLMGLAGSEMIRAAQTVGIPYIREGYADRRYTTEGTLASRSLPGAVIEDVDQVVAQVLQIVLTQSVTTVGGEVIGLEIDSLCVHGDNAHALEVVKAVRMAMALHDVALEAHGGKR